MRSFPVRFLALFAALFVALAGVNDASAAANPFRVEAEAPALAPKAESVVRITLVVPDGFHVYRDMMAVDLVDAGGLTVGDASFPPGLQKPDPANPGNMREQFDMNVVIEVPVTAPDAAGTYEAVFSVRYQGCKKALCYMPATDELRVPVSVAATQGARHLPAAAWQRASALVSTVGSSAATAAVAPPAVDFSGVQQSADVQDVDPAGKKHPVRARLITDASSVKAGGVVRLGVHLEQKPGWHTYWRSPGDIGLPTDITWTVPDGATTTPYAFPAPHRYDYQGIISYGYDDQVMFFTDVTLPDPLPAGDVRFAATANWLVCEVSCIPGSAELSLTVPQGDGAAGPMAPLFDHFAAQHPIDPTELRDFAVEVALSASAVHPEEAFQIAVQIVPTGDGAAFPVEVGTWPVFTPIVQGDWMIMGTRSEPVDGGGVRIIIDAETFEADPLPTTDVVGGLVQVKVGDKWVRTEVVKPLVWAAPGAAVVPSPLPWFTPPADAVATAELAPEPAPAPAAAPKVDAPLDLAEMASMLGLAFVGGMILNVMPCVLPVLSLKLFSLVEQADSTAAHRRTAGLAYTAGIVLSFWALAIAVLVMKQVTGASVGWGVQFQYTGYVAALATVVFVFGLSLFGVFEVPAFGANKAAQASTREGAVGYLLTGVFATLLATPCSAPFLGTGMGFAFSLPPLGVMLFFTVAGLGLASPFLLIAFVPSLMRFLPRPGAWMETFKEVLGFTLIATTVWLVDVLGSQVGRDGMTGFLAFLTVVGLGAWIVGRWGGLIATNRAKATSLAVAIGLSALAGWQFLDLEPAPANGAVAEMGDINALDFSEHVPWQPFTEARVDELDGRTVFIDFTAEWCLTCKVNEKTVLSTETVRNGMAERGVVPLKADWTRRDEVITKWLRQYGKAGVPFYLVVPADRSKAPIPLPEVITPDVVVAALDRAGA